MLFVAGSTTTPLGSPNGFSEENAHFRWRTLTGGTLRVLGDAAGGISILPFALSLCARARRSVRPRQLPRIRDDSSLFASFCSSLRSRAKKVTYEGKKKKNTRRGERVTEQSVNRSETPSVEICTGAFVCAVMAYEFSS